MNLSVFYARMLTGLVLYRPSADSRSCCGLMNATVVLLRPEDTVHFGPPQILGL